MLSPALLVVFVMSPARVEPMTVAFEQAAQEVLGPSAELRLEGVHTSLSDADALGRAGQADGVVEMSWNGARQTVVLRCYIASEQRWVDRTIQFARADRAPDRGRMLGFAVASMFVGAPSFARARAAQQPSVEPGAPDTSAAEPAPVASPRSEVLTNSAPEVIDAPPAAAPLAGPNGGPRSLEFAGVVTGGSGASAGAEVGAQAGLGWPLSVPLSLHVQVAGRAGEIAVAQANVRRASAGVGLSWNTFPDAGSFELRLTVHALGNWFQVSHLSSDDIARVSNHGFLFGGDAVATLGYRISPLLSCFAGAGIEAMAGKIHVFTHGVEQATLPALRGLGQLGFLTHF